MFFSFCMVYIVCFLGFRFDIKLEVQVICEEVLEDCLFINWSYVYYNKIIILIRLG